MKKEREIFKPIKGYENKYLVSNLGRVWSIKRKQQMKPYKDKYGYLYVQLADSSYQAKFKSHKVHRLVYEAFSGNIPKGYDIDHVDQNKQNNNIKNLVAISHSDHIKRHKAGKPIKKETLAKIIATKRRNKRLHNNKNI